MSRILEPGERDPELDPLALAVRIGESALRINGRLLEERLEEAKAMKMRWFGRSWGAPANESLEQVDAPIGQPCLKCQEKVEAGQRGVILSTVGEDYEVSPQPVHLECFIEMTLGPALARLVLDELPPA